MTTKPEYTGATIPAPKLATEHVSAAAAPVPPSPTIVHVTNVQRASFRRTSHVFHLIATLLTGGLWLLVYIPIAVSHHSINKKNGY